MTERDDAILEALAELAAEIIQLRADLLALRQAHADALGTFALALGTVDQALERALRLGMAHSPAAQTPAKRRVGRPKTKGQP